MGRATEREIGGTSYADVLARLAGNVRRLRESRGLTQQQVAERAGLSIYQLRLVEGANANATAETLARLAQSFEVDVLELLQPAVVPPKRAPGRPRRRAQDR